MSNNFVNQFKQSVSDFALKSGGSFEGEAIRAVGTRMLSVVGTVRFSAFSVKFLYHVGRPNVPKSVLSMLFFKNTDPFKLGFFMYDLLNVIDTDDFSPYNFAYLPDTEAMSQAFEAMFAGITKNFDAITDLFTDDGKFDVIRKSKMEDITAVFGRDVFSQAESMDADMRNTYLSRVYDMFFSTVVTRFSSIGYSLFLRGEREAALKRYCNYRHLTAYEYRMVELMDDCTKPMPTSPVYDHIADGFVAERGKGAFLPVFLSWLAGTALLTPIFYGLYMLIAFVLSDGAVLSTAMQPYNAIDSVLPASLTALSLCRFFKSNIFAVFSKSKRDIYKRYENIINLGKKGGISKYVVVTAVAIAIIFTMLCANCGVRFYEDRMLINPSLTSLRPTERAYSDVDTVIMYGGYGSGDNYVESPGTVIMFEDGKWIDFGGYVDNETFKTEVFKYFKNVRFRNIKSIDDINKLKLDNNKNESM